MSDNLHEDTPNIWNIVYSSSCRALAAESTDIGKLTVLSLAARYCTEAILRHEVGSRSVRSIIKHLTSSLFIRSTREVLDQINSNIISTIVRMNKKIPITGQLIKKKINVGPSNLLSLNTLIDLVYSRKDGPCYSVILSDMVGSDDDTVAEMVHSHLAVCAAVLADEAATSNMVRYIEAIIPNTEDISKRYLIRLDSSSTEYIEYCRSIVRNALRRFLVEEEHLTNWSYKCIWCPQEGRCRPLRSSREKFRGVVQRI